MNFVHEYLAAEEEHQFVLLRSFLHGIKYESEEDCFSYFGDFDFTQINDDTKESLVRLAVYVSHALSKRFKKLPSWAKNEALVMQPAYLGRGYSEAWLLYGPDAMRRHNFFIDPGALEVM